MDIQFNVDQALAKLGELVAKHGPEAVDMAARVMQMSGVGKVGIGLFALTASVAMGGTAYLLLKSGRARKPVWEAYSQRMEKYRYPSITAGPDEPTRPEEPVGGSGEWQMNASAGFAAVSLCAFFWSLINLLDIWAWVAIFQPKLALAHQILINLGAM